METKLCGSCGCTKPLTEYYVNRRAKDGLTHFCAECNKKRTRKWSEENWDRYLEWRREQWKGPTLRRAKELCQQLRYRAKKEGLPYDLKPEDLLPFPEKCPILGITLDYESTGRKKGHFHHNSPSVDKLIPERGYTKDNICVISMRANSIKTDANFEEVAKLYKWMKKQYAALE